MRLRDITGLILAFILAIGVAFLTRFFLAPKEKPVAEVILRPARMTKVLVAGKTLSRGDTIKAGDLIWQEWPNNAVIPTYLTESTAKQGEFLGSVVRFTIHRGNPIVKEELIKRGEKGVLAAIVASGKRAVSIDITPSSSDSGLIIPGDFVDVILSTTVSATTPVAPLGIPGTTGLPGALGNAASTNSQQGKSKTILKNVKVLAIDTTLESLAEKPKTPPHVATLEVTPVQAEILTAGAKEGAITLSLRSMEIGEADPVPETIERPEEKKVILMRGKEKSEIQFQEKK